MSGSILEIMNFRKVCAVALFLVFPLWAMDTLQINRAVDEKFVQYLAGIELMDHSKSINGNVLAERYRELCSMTGFATDLAAKRIMDFKNRPALWQSIRIRVLELLQSLK